MSFNHIVEQGECLANIAARYSISDWGLIYNHPKNASFRELRPDPHVIFPGDQIFVPDPELKNEPGATEQQHNYQLQAQPTLLRIVLEDEDGQPFGYQKYELSVGSQLYNGSTDGSGLLEQLVDPTASSGQLVIWKHEDGKPPRGITWLLEVGSLDPVEETTGVQARLNNLGYNSGPVDGIQGPITTGAVKEFQGEHELKVDGIVGPKTRAKLKQVYGC